VFHNTFLDGVRCVGREQGKRGERGKRGGEGKEGKEGEFDGQTGNIETEFGHVSRSRNIP